MTNGCAAEPARWPNRVTCGSSAVVTGSVTSAVVSVLACTRPSPGKCFSVAVTPARSRASTTVPTAGATASGVLPYWRSNWPIGSLAASLPAGTTSATGARSRLTPALRSAVPMPSARVASSAGGSAPCSRAEGSLSKPGPWSVWTSPPSWSTATQRPGPGERDCQRCAVAASSVAGAVDRPAMNSPPTPLSASASPPSRSSSGTPATNSWATWARRSSPASAASTGSAGVAGAGELDDGVDEAPARGVPGRSLPHADSSRQSASRDVHTGARCPVVGMELLRHEWRDDGGGPAIILPGRRGWSWPRHPPAPRGPGARRPSGGVIRSGHGWRAGATRAPDGDRQAGRAVDRRVRQPAARLQRAGPLPRGRRAGPAAPAGAAQPARRDVRGPGRRDRPDRPGAARVDLRDPRPARRVRPAAGGLRADPRPPGRVERLLGPAGEGGRRLRPARHRERQDPRGLEAVVLAAVAAPAAEQPGHRTDAVLRDPQPVDQGHQVLLDAPQCVRHGVDDRVVEHPAHALDARLQRAHRLLELLDEVLEPLGDALRRGDRGVRHRRRLGQLLHGAVEVAEGAGELGQRLGLRLQEGHELAEPRDAGHPEPA